MGHEEIIVAIAIEIGGHDAHARLGTTVRVDRSADLHRSVFEASVTDTSPKLVLG